MVEVEQLVLLLLPTYLWRLCGNRQVSQWVADNELMVSKYAENLPHEDTGRKISSDPKTWVCEESGKTENLWLNLSTGELGTSRLSGEILRYLCNASVEVLDVVSGLARNGPTLT